LIQLFVETIAINRAFLLSIVPSALYLVLKTHWELVMFFWPSYGTRN